jgi:hypothetical protein
MDEEKSLVVLPDVGPREVVEDSGLPSVSDGSFSTNDGSLLTSPDSRRSRRIQRDDPRSWTSLSFRPSRSKQAPRYPYSTLLSFTALRRMFFWSLSDVHEMRVLRFDELGFALKKGNCD